MKNSIHILAIVALLIILSIGFYSYFNKDDIQSVDITYDDSSPIDTTGESYYSEDNQEAILEFFADNLNLIFLGNANVSKYRNVTLDRVVTPNESFYQNSDYGLVVKVNGDDVKIYKDNELIFVSYKTGEDLLNESTMDFLTSATWQWIFTTERDSDFKIIPKNESAFRVNFTKEGNVSSTTDCNNFGGTFEIDDGDLKIGQLMSTLKFCEGSQESDFVNDFVNISHFTIEKDGGLSLLVKDSSRLMLFKPVYSKN